MTTYSSILAQRIPWTEDPGVLSSLGLQRIWYDWSNRAYIQMLFYFILRFLYGQFLKSWVYYNIASVYVLVFWLRGMWDLAPWPGIEPASPTLKTLITGPQGSPDVILNIGKHLRFSPGIYCVMFTLDQQRREESYEASVVHKRPGDNRSKILWPKLCGGWLLWLSFADSESFQRLE